VPPTSPTQQDAVIIEKALVEESALAELGFKFQLTATGEYELDGRLTFVSKRPPLVVPQSDIQQGDLESLIERSFLIRENTFRRQYRQLQWHNQPTTPSIRTNFDQKYAPSIASTTPRSSRGSCTSTEVGQTEDEQFDSSQTSQADLLDGNSVWDGDCDAAVSPSATSWSDKSTNPFRMRLQDGKTRSSQNPWGTQCIWDGASLL
jgi:hypothetical protein